MLGLSLSYHPRKIIRKGAIVCHEYSFQNQLKNHGDMYCARMECSHASLCPFDALKVFLLSGIYWRGQIRWKLK